MGGPYSFLRHTNNDEVIYAQHINELQQAIEELGAIRQAPIASGQLLSGRNVVGGSSDMGSMPANVLRFVPIWTGPSGVAVDRIGLYVGTGSGGDARLGFFTAHPDSAAPNTLITDAGAVSLATSGFKSIAGSWTLLGIAPYRIVWAACVLSADTSVQRLGSYAGGGWLASVPWGEQIAATGYAVNCAYGALPASAGAVTRDNAFDLFVRTL